MRITRSQLRQLIKEEVEGVVDEASKVGSGAHQHGSVKARLDRLEGQVAAIVKKLNLHGDAVEDAAQ